jgi:hypothetical protein
MQKVLRRFIMDDLKRLIDASPVYEDLRKSYEELRSIMEILTDHEDIQICNGQLTTFAEALIRIKNAPTVDAVEVVHAQWLDGSGMSRDGSIVYESIDCSHCEEVFKIKSRTREYWKERFKVCPFCGAKMDGGNEDV